MRAALAYLSADYARSRIENVSLALVWALGIPVVSLSLGYLP